MKNIIIAALLCVVILTAVFSLTPLFRNGAEKKPDTKTLGAEPDIILPSYPFSDDFENGEIAPWIPESLPEEWSTEYVAAPGGQRFEKR